MLNARLNEFQSHFTILLLKKQITFFYNKVLHVLAYEKPIIRLFFLEIY
jgi:hypothetical protein